MIQIDPVDFIPNLPYAKTSLSELTRHSFDDLSRSNEIYVAREGSTPLFCIGVYRATLTSQPYVWLLACEALSWRHLRDLKICFAELAPAAMWAMVKDEPSIRKFAQFFGMVQVKTTQIGDDNYLMMER
jgi:hypothetical protein